MASAPVPTLLTRAASSTDATSYATASLTPVSGRVLLAYCATQITAGTANTPTATGTNGLSGTWTAIANSVQDQTKITLFRSVAASSSAGVLTFDLAGQTQLGACWEVLQWINVSTTINVQSKTAVTNGGTTLNFGGDPLVAFTGAFNGTYACMAASGSFVTVRGADAQGTMFQIPTSSNSLTELAACDFYSPGETNSPSLGCSGAGSDLVAIAIEVAADATSGGGGSLVGGLLVR